MVYYKIAPYNPLFKQHCKYQYWVFTTDDEEYLDWGAAPTWEDAECEAFEDIMFRILENDW